jgi:hypothetical protein
MFIAPFALIYAFYIIVLYAIIYVRKKILEEGRNLRGVPTFLGAIAFFLMIGILYTGFLTFYFLSYFSFFVIPLLILIPLIIEYKANSKIKRKEVTGYQVIHREMNWTETVGIIGPVLVLIGCSLLFFSSIMYIFWGWYYLNYISILFTWICSLNGFAGVLFGLKGRTYGRFLCFLSGALVVAGCFIFIGPWGTILTVSFIGYFDPFIVLIGGILSVASQNDFLMYYVKGRDLSEEFISIEEEIDKIKDLKLFLQEKLGSDWENIKISFKAYQVGELDKNTFITTAIKNVGNKFIEIFKEEKRGKINEI